MKTKWLRGRFWQEIVFGWSFNIWSVTGWCSRQLEVGGENIESNNNYIEKETEWSHQTGWCHGQLWVGGKYIKSNQDWLEIQTEWSCTTTAPLDNVVSLGKICWKIWSRRVKYWKVARNSLEWDEASFSYMYDRMFGRNVPRSRNISKLCCSFTSEWYKILV